MVKDAFYDNHSLTLQISLNRQRMTNTAFQTIAQSSDGAIYPSSGARRGTDPTYGAWLRLCIFRYGNGYCETKYFSDNSS